MDVLQHPAGFPSMSGGVFALFGLAAKGREVPYEVRRGVLTSLFLLCTPLANASGVLCFWEVACDI